MNDFEIDEMVVFDSNGQFMIGKIYSIDRNDDEPYSIIADRFSSYCKRKDLRKIVHPEDLQKVDPRVVEMNKRVCRGPNYEAHISEFHDDMFFGRYKLKKDKAWNPSHWHKDGYFFKNIGPSILDLIEPPIEMPKEPIIKEWNVDYYVYLLPNSGETEILTESQMIKQGSKSYGALWKERRHYKSTDGVTKFVRSEVIEE